MLQRIDKWLNGTTMYKVVLYCLRTLLVVSLVFSFFGWIDYSPWQLLLTLGILIVVGEAVNYSAAKIVGVPRNIESMPITALILFFVILPVESPEEAGWAAAAAAIAMLSKYVLVYRQKHIFNPAAIALVITGLLGAGHAGWWVGSAVLALPVALFGLLVVRKIRGFQITGLFICTALITTLFSFAIMGLTVTPRDIVAFLVSGPVLFFAGFLLTEPLTMPPRRHAKLMYAATVGVLFGASFSIGPLYTSPELALVVGNVIAFAIYPTEQLVLQLERKRKLVPRVYEFEFVPNRTFRYQPGQYMEWMVPHKKPDARGIRRFFTIVSSPTEKKVKLAIRSGNDGSTYKKALLALKEGSEIYAAKVAGDFILPESKDEKLLFIAGGIGVTPFRSMIQYVIDEKQQRDITLVYFASSEDDFVYREVFELAKTAIGLKGHYIVSGKSRTDTGKLLVAAVPDYGSRLCYLSGPTSLVDVYRAHLQGLGVASHRIKTDHFSGL